MVCIKKKKTDADTQRKGKGEFLEFSSLLLYKLSPSSGDGAYIPHSLKNIVNPKLYTVEQTVLVLYVQSAMKWFRSINYVTEKLDLLKKENSKPDKDVN